MSFKCENHESVYRQSSTMLEQLLSKQLLEDLPRDNLREKDKTKTFWMLPLWA